MINSYYDEFLEKEIYGYCEYCHDPVELNDEFEVVLEAGLIKIYHKECLEVLNNERLINE